MCLWIKFRVSAKHEHNAMARCVCQEELLRSSDSKKIFLAGAMLTLYFARPPIPSFRLFHPARGCPSCLRSIRLSRCALPARFCLFFAALRIYQEPRHLVPLIFVDTLYHFPQTLDLAKRAAKHYGAPMHVYTPPGTSTVAEFEAKWGAQLWERDEETYDYLVKVEPARRAYEELGVRAVFTGRRRSQGDDRASLKAVEVDETGLVKVNPFLNWSFGQVDSYVKQNAVPYNELLDMGYKSIGDWHSTALPGTGGGERSGRWKDKGGKTECGLHTDYFRMKRIADKKMREFELARKDEARDKAGVAAAEAPEQTLVASSS